MSLCVGEGGGGGACLPLKDTLQIDLSLKSFESIKTRTTSRHTLCTYVCIYVQCMYVQCMSSIIYSEIWHTHLT